MNKWIIRVMLAAALTLFAFTIWIVIQMATAVSARAAEVPTLAQYALQINFMSDRADGYWREKYDTAKAKRENNLARDDVKRRLRRGTNRFRRRTTLPSQGSRRP